jgi:hypothetical protein
MSLTRSDSLLQGGCTAACVLHGEEAEALGVLEEPEKDL